MEDILDEAKRITSTDRRADYGSMTEGHQIIADLWNPYIKKILAKKENLDAFDISQLMILMKVARNTCNRKRDNNVDIAGYSRCGAEMEGWNGVTTDLGDVKDLPKTTTLEDGDEIVPNTAYILDRSGNKLRVGDKVKWSTVSEGTLKERHCKLVSLGGDPEGVTIVEHSDGSREAVYIVDLHKEF